MYSGDTISNRNKYGTYFSELYRGEGWPVEHGCYNFFNSLDYSDSAGSLLVAGSSLTLPASVSAIYEASPDSLVCLGCASSCCSALFID
jgi:hypothetical protein